MTDFNVAIANDGDCYFTNKVGGDTFWTEDYLILGISSSKRYHSAAVFRNVNIPQGSTIISAFVRFIAYSSLSDDTCTVKIHCEDADNATVAVNAAQCVGVDLTAGTDWTALPAWTVGTTYDSADFTAELQTVIDREGWLANNRIGVQFIDSVSTPATCNRRPRTHDYSDGSSAPVLYVTYVSGLIGIDGVAVSEITNIELEFLGELQEYENISISENSEVGLDKLVSNFENVALTENVTVELFEPFYFPESGDDLTLSEFVGLDFYSYLHEPQAGDDVGLSENVEAKLDDLGASAIESIALTEFVGFPIYGDTAEAMQIGDEVTAFNWSAWFALNKNKAIPRYFCTLTGAPDGTTDIQIPISSLQARKRTGNPTYVAVVVPGFDYAQQITDRANGELVIELGYEIDGTIEFLEEILRATLEDIRTDEGPVNRAISLSGHKTETFATQITTIENSIYRSLQSGNIVHRFAHIDPYLNPGDTCRAGDDEFTVDYIIYMVNSYGTTMEVREG